MRLLLACGLGLLGCGAGEPGSGHASASDSGPREASGPGHQDAAPPGRGSRQGVAAEGGSASAPLDATSRDASLRDASTTRDARPADSTDANLPIDAGTPVRACTGSAVAAGGAAPQLLRSDMSVRLLYASPATATRLERNPQDGAFYIAVEDGDIFRVALTAAGAEQSLAYAAGEIGLDPGEQVWGMAFAPSGTLFVVSHMPASVAGFEQHSRARVWRGVATGNGDARSWAKLAETAPYPRSGNFDHECNGIAVSSDAQSVYVNCGSRTDHGEVEDLHGAHAGVRESGLTAVVLRLPADASELGLPDDAAALAQDGYLFARGLRNSFDLELAPDGALWAGENGPDGDYHEELNPIEQGKDYGFPWRLGTDDNAMRFPDYDPAQDLRLQPVYGATANGLWYNDPDFPPPPSGVSFSDPILNLGPDADQYRDPSDGSLRWAGAQAPIGTFSAHGSPLGLTFDDGSGALCGEFSGAAFVLRYGIAGGDFEPGEDLLHVRLQRSGGRYATAQVTQIARGLPHPVDAELVGDTLYVLARGNDSSGPGLYALTLPH